MRPGWAVALLRRVWALGWLLVLLVGVPVGLVAAGGRPDPRRLPAWGRDRLQGTDGGLTRHEAIMVAVLVGWGLWLWLLAAVATTLVRAVRRWRHPHWRLPTPAQAGVTGIVGSLVLGAAAGAGGGTPAVAAPPVASPTAPATGVEGAAAGREALAGPASLLADVGWVAHDLAAAVAGAAAAAWVARQRAYRPRFPGPSHRADPDLQPLPSTVTALAALAVPPPEGGPLLDAGGLPPRLVLAGPGAHAAARGLLLRAVLADQRRAVLPQIAMDTASLQRLLDAPSAVNLATRAGVVVTGTDDPRLASAEIMVEPAGGVLVLVAGPGDHSTVADTHGATVVAVADAVPPDGWIRWCGRWPLTAAPATAPGG